MSMRNRSAVSPDAAMRIVSKTLIGLPAFMPTRRTAASSAGRGRGNIGETLQIRRPFVPPRVGPRPPAPVPRPGPPRTAAGRPGRRRTLAPCSPEPKSRSAGSSRAPSSGSASTGPRPAIGRRGARIRAVGPAMLAPGRSAGDDRGLGGRVPGLRPLRGRRRRRGLPRPARSGSWRRSLRSTAGDGRTAARSGSGSLAFPAPAGSTDSVGVLRLDHETGEADRRCPTARPSWARPGGCGGPTGLAGVAGGAARAGRGAAADRRGGAGADDRDHRGVPPPVHHGGPRPGQRRPERRRRLDTLARETLRESEQARTHIAHTLHDTAAQSMVSAHRFMEAARASLGGPRPEVAPQHLDAAQERLLAAIREVRLVLNTLVPPGLEELGIANALRIYVRDNVPGGHRDRGGRRAAARRGLARGRAVRDDGRGDRQRRPARGGARRSGSICAPRAGAASSASPTTGSASTPRRRAGAPRRAWA